MILRRFDSSKDTEPSKWSWNWYIYQMQTKDNVFRVVIIKLCWTSAQKGKLFFTLCVCVCVVNNDMLLWLIAMKQMNNVINRSPAMPSQTSWYHILLCVHLIECNKKKSLHKLKTWTLLCVAVPLFVFPKEKKNLYSQNCSHSPHCRTIFISGRDVPATKHYREPWNYWKN